MKTKLAIIATAALLLSGCVSSSTAKKLEAFEAMGVSEVVITGKFSNTEYKVEHENGERTATLQHSNAWLTRVKVVRKTKE
jgi:ABC-type uncharacterized transport system auxiliary subunit